MELTHCRNSQKLKTNADNTYLNETNTLMAKGHLHQIHPILPVKNVIDALNFYVQKLGFTIAFADHDKTPSYAGIRRDNIEIHLQWHDAKEWEAGFNTPMLRIVAQNIEALF